MTTYYERRRLLSEIRSLIPTTPGQQQKHTPSTPTNVMYSRLVCLNGELLYAYN